MRSPTARLWMQLAASVLLLVVFAAMIIARVLSVEEQAAQSSHARSVDAAALQMELRARGYTLAVREFAESGRGNARQLARLEAEGMARQLREYEQLTAGTGRQALLEQVFPAWTAMHALGEVVLARPVPAMDASESSQLFARRARIEALLQQAAPRESATAVRERRKRDLDRLRGSLDAAVGWLLSGLALVLVVIALVARRIVATERGLWDSRERLRLTLASIGDGVISTDGSGRVTYLNPAASTLTGWAPGEASGRPLAEVFTAVDEAHYDGHAEQHEPPLPGLAGDLLRQAAPAVDTPGAAGGGEASGLFPGQARLLARGGGCLPIDYSVAPIRDAGGVASGVILVFCDASARRSAEETLRQANLALERRVDARTAELGRTNRFLSALLDNLQEGIVACDAQGRLTLFNRATREFHGMPQEALELAQWADHYDLLRADGVTRMDTDEVPLVRALRGERVRSVEMVIAPREGRRRWLLASGHAFHDGEGQLLGAVVSMNDITLRKEAEQALRNAYADLEARVAERTSQLTSVNAQLRAEVAVRQEAEAQLEGSQARKTAMFESALDCIISIDHDDRIIEFNAAAERTFGYRREDVMGQGMAELLIPPAARDGHRRGMARYLATGRDEVLDRRLELTAQRADGSVFPVELTVTRIPLPGAPTFTAYLRDISEARRAQAALAATETQWRGIFERLHEGFVLGEMLPGEDGTADDWRYLEMNAAWETITGLSREDSQGKTLREVLPTVGDEWVTEFARVVETGLPATFTRHNASLDRWYEVHAYRAAPSRFAALFLEVTERQRTQLQLQESEERLRFVMDSMPQKIFTARPDGAVLYFNPPWLEFAGRTMDQMRGWGWSDLVHPDDVQENLRTWKHAVETCGVYEFEQRFRAADGEYRWHLSRARALRAENGEIRMWIGSNTDIDDQKRASDQLARLAEALAEADRRKTEFLAVLAHELRNPLAPLGNAVQILRMAGGDSGAERPTLDPAPLVEMMDRQVRHMVHLVDDLLDVSRISRGKIGLRRERVPLASIIDQAIESGRGSAQCVGQDILVS
ncbi:MAG: PAS domain S-box protein, partial [Pseudomonadota bacterium]|nr:PAS domain S-box protein [Pseudomonadota bacterium]